MMLDATQNFNKKLTKTRLFNWHASLFPTGRNGMFKIRTGNWRNDANGPMQVVSGAIGKEKVHYEAPAAQHIELDMMQFFNWINTANNLDPVLKAGIAHLWFVTIHPFEDGNGRIARAITDLLLAKADKTPQRFYSMSAQIRKDRKAYYLMLEKTKQGNLAITKWLLWFLDCLLKSIQTANKSLEKVLKKQAFWNTHATTLLNDRQHKMINLLMDDFKGKLSSSKWAKMNKCSTDTALRDIQDLISKSILRKEAAGGRSTNYELLI